MGIMNDLGILDADNNLVEGIWLRYVLDVKNKLKGENVKVFEDVNTNTPPPPPDPQADLLRLEDEEEFPQFRPIWYSRYQDMARGLNTEGGFNPAIPIADPTAIAAATGATPPDMSLGEAVAGAVAVGAIQPPKDPTKLVPVVFPSLSPDELIAKTPELGPKIGEALAAPPLPPIPPVPDPRILEAGYTEQAEFDKKLAESPLKTYQALLENVSQLPGIIAELPSGPKGLLEFVGLASEASQPKRMETSSFEEAAAQVLKQHQDRLQSGQFLASNIGSGAIAKAVVTGPMELTPVDGDIIFPEISDIIEIPPASAWAGTISARRQRILSILEETFDETGPNGQKFTAQQWPDAAALATEAAVSDATKAVATKVSGVLGFLGGGTQKTNPADPGPPVAKKQQKQQIHEAGTGWVEANYGQADWKGPGTSCGLLPPHVFRKLGIPEYPVPSNLFFSIDAAVWKVSEYVASSGIDVSPFVAGPTNFKWLGILTDTFVWAWDINDVPTGNTPKPGDIYVIGAGDDPSSVIGSVHPKIAEQDGARYGTGVQHVGVVVDFDFENRKFITADFGQNPLGNKAQGGCYREREIIITKEGKFQVDGEGPPKAEGKPKRNLIGWIDVDLLQF